MKKTKRLAVLLAAVLACGTMAFSACVNDDNNADDGNNDSNITDDINGGNNNSSNSNNGSGDSNGDDNVGIEVTKEEWIKRFTINEDNYDSLTARYYAEYVDEDEGKVEAEYTTKFDFVNQIYYESSLPIYIFIYKDNYYEWHENWVTNKIYIYDLETELSHIFFDTYLEAMTASLPFKSEEYYEMATFNAQTGTYEIVMEDEYAGEITIFIQFFQNGDLKLIGQADEMYAEMSFENINSTTITVPEQAYADVDAYLAEHVE